MLKYTSPRRAQPTGGMLTGRTATTAQMPTSGHAYSAADLHCDDDAGMAQSLTAAPPQHAANGLVRPAANGLVMSAANVDSNEASMPRDHNIELPDQSTRSAVNTANEVSQSAVGTTEQLSSHQHKKPLPLPTPQVAEMQAAIEAHAVRRYKSCQLQAYLHERLAYHQPVCGGKEALISSIIAQTAKQGKWLQAGCTRSILYSVSNTSYS